MPRARRPAVMFQWYRVMRVPALALVVLAGVACGRGSLQRDASAGGSLTPDGAGGAIGSGGAAGGGAFDGGPPWFDAALPTADANCGEATFTSHYLVPQILMLIDQSVADRAKWTSLLMALGGSVAGNGNRIDWGVYSFPELGPACAAETVNATIDLAITPMNYVAANAALGLLRLNANGTPTAAAIAMGAAYMRTLPADNPRYLMLVTDGAPTCASAIGALTADLAQAQADAVAAITAAAAEGFPTLVVAPAMTPDSEIDALDALAVAGGYANSQARGKFLTEAALGPFLLTEGRSCVFALPKRPAVPVPDPRVTFDGRDVPRDPSHTSGWDYNDPTSMSIELYGSWCAQVFDTRQSEIRVYYPCLAI